MLVKMGEGGSQWKGRWKGKVLMESERCRLLHIMWLIVFMCCIAQNKIHAVQFTLRAGYFQAEIYDDSQELDEIEFIP